MKENDSVDVLFRDLFVSPGPGECIQDFGLLARAMDEGPNLQHSATEDPSYHVFTDTSGGAGIMSTSVDPIWTNIQARGVSKIDSMKRIDGSGQHLPKKSY